MSTTYFRLIKAVKNPFVDRRASHGVEQFEWIPEGALLQFNSVIDKIEVGDKVVERERLHSVYWITNDYRKFSIDYSTYKKNQVPFWDVLADPAVSVSSQPESNSEIHFACFEPAIDFYIELLRKNGYTFGQLNSLHDEYAATHYQ